MRRSLVLAFLPTLAASTAAAQRDTTQLPPGVQLETRYTLANRQMVSVRPFGGAEAIADVRSQVSQIMGNDLTLSDRFRMMPAPVALATPGTVDYVQWNSLNVVFLVAGDVIVTPSGYELRLEVHDVPLGRLKQSGSFPLPTAASPDFRMAVHAVADEVVRWITGQPGIAATRIAFVRQNGNGSYDLLTVDSDGENLRRLFGTEMLYSPAWSPDGQRLAYTVRGQDGWQLVERDLANGRSRVVHSGAGLLMTPTYSPDGSKLVFSIYLAGGSELHEIDVRSGGGLERISDSNGDNLSPGFSGDGRRLAFHSSRTGRQHIYVMPAGGGNAQLLSPLGQTVEYYGPDWSPTGTQVAFYGRSRGFFQIMLADAARPGSPVLQLTSEGRNEDPSWAPDGRHIVYTGGAGGNEGLYVIDVVTGQTRLLAEGRRLRLPDWSPSLARTVGLAAGGN
jgi:TolB protein